MVIASFWGASVLAIRLVKHWFARVCLGLTLLAVFLIAGTTAVIAGCNVVMGPVNFH